MDIIYWDSYYNTMLLLNLSVAIILFTCLRLFSGTISRINASDELLRKDNPAFGISLAGVTLAITILLSGTIYGDPEASYLVSAIAVGVFGAVGIGLLALARFVFDRVALPGISIRDEIAAGNISVAIADTGNVLAAAIILRAIMVWISDNSLESVTVLLIAYALSQVVLTLVTFLRSRVFNVINKEKTIEEELRSNNIALALVFAGRKIGTALAISVAANLVVYEVFEIKTILLPWLMISLVVIMILKVLTFIAERIILFRVDIKHEVLTQRNVAIGALQAAIYISLALLVAEI